jgi:hypothetical protein
LSKYISVQKKYKSIASSFRSISFTSDPFVVTTCYKQKRPAIWPGVPTFSKPHAVLLCCLRLLHIVTEHHHIVKYIYQHRVHLVDGTSQDLFTQGIHNFLLDKPLQRTGTKLRIKAVIGKVIEQVLGELLLDTVLRHQLF